MNLYEMTLNHSSGRFVYKLILCKPDNSIAGMKNVRMIVQNFPDVGNTIFDSIFFGVSKFEIKCKDAARRVYRRPAKGAQPITPFFESVIEAENHMKRDYGENWLDNYSVVYVEIQK